MSNALRLTLPEGAPYADFDREFDFPVSAVFRAHSSPELYVQWIGPRGLTSRLDGYDAASGGSFRLVQAGDDGVEFAFRGTFHVVRENEFVLNTFEFEGYEGDEATLDYTWFRELPGGRTLLTGHAVYPSVEARNRWAEAGMEEGMRQGYEQLDALLTELFGEPGNAGAP